ncbi:hypothetical protein GCM10010350_16180 [Streptomyces galilaeus]|nr:hypothetical protein GCM10010350_16180 [Streptomyces galilaeus]
MPTAAAEVAEAAPAAAATQVSTAARVPRVVDFISGTDPFGVLDEAVRGTTRLYARDEAVRA